DKRVDFGFAHLDCQTAQSIPSTLAVPAHAFGCGGAGYGLGGGRARHHFSIVRHGLCPPPLFCAVSSVGRLRRGGLHSECRAKPLTELSAKSRHFFRMSIEASS